VPKGAHRAPQMRNFTTLIKATSGKPKGGPKKEWKIIKREEKGKDPTHTKRMGPKKGGPKE